MYDSRPEVRPLEEACSEFIKLDLAQLSELEDSARAAGEALAMLYLWAELELQAQEVIRPYEKEVFRNAKKHFGLLTELVQVKGSVVFHKLNNQAIRFDHELAEKLKQSLHQRTLQCIQTIEANPAFKFALFSRAFFVCF